MATGLVELIGTTIGSTGSESGTAADERDKAFDGDFTTFYSADSVSGDWVGKDAGSACVLRAVLIAARRGETTSDTHEARLIGAKIQVSSAADFSSDVTDVYTIPAHPFIPSLHFTRIEIAGAPSKRYMRLLSATNGRCNVGELAFIVEAGPSAARPLPPVIAPWGGRFSAGSATTTLTTETTSAAQYYTVDASTPDNGDTAYSVPFALDASPPITFKAIAYDAGLDTPYSRVSTAFFKDYDFAPNEDMYDDRGVLIEAHNGGIMYAEGRYWWYGTNCNGFNDVGTLDFNGRTGVWLYSSSDFVNWRFEGNILAKPTNSDVLRPHVMYNALNSEYVMWARLWFGTDSGKAIRATASAPEGPWTWTDPEGVQIGTVTFLDNNVFKDDDGKGYLVYQDGSVGLETVIHELDADYAAVTANEIRFEEAVESPAMFKRDDVYFLICGVGTYYDSSLSYGIKYFCSAGATPLAAEWIPAAARLLYTTDPVGTDFNGQPTEVVHIQALDEYVLLSDFWVESDIYDSRYVFLPLRFVGKTQVKITTPATWDLEAGAFDNNPVDANDIQSILGAYYRFDEEFDDPVDAHASVNLTETGTVGNLTGVMHAGRGAISGGTSYFSSSNALFNFSGHTSFSIFGWFKMSAPGGFASIFGKDDSGSNRDYGVYDGTGKLSGYASTNGTALTTVDFTITLTEHNWYFFVLSHDADADVVRLRAGPYTLGGGATLAAGQTAAFAGGVHNGAVPIQFGTIGFLSMNGLDNWGVISGAVLTPEQEEILFNGGEGADYVDLFEEVASGSFSVFESSTLIGAME